MTRRIANIIHYANKTQMPSLLLSVDADKAFDRVHWLYMTKVLEKFGFHGTIITATMALYSNPSAQVNSSGLLSKPFSITNGTRQGCLLFPSVFNLMIEPLAEAICSNPGVTGFQLGKYTHKINLFADDIILLLTNPDSSLPEAFQIFTQFSLVSVLYHTTRSMPPSS